MAIHRLKKLGSSDRETRKKEKERKKNIKELGYSNAKDLSFRSKLYFILMLWCLSCCNYQTKVSVIVQCRFHLYCVICIFIKVKLWFQSCLQKQQVCFSLFSYVFQRLLSTFQTFSFRFVKPAENLKSDQFFQELININYMACDVLPKK